MCSTPSNPIASSASSHGISISSPIGVICRRPFSSRSTFTSAITIALT